MHRNGNESDDVALKRMDLSVYRYSQIVIIIKVALKWGFWGWFVYNLRLIIVGIAGTSTLFEFAVDFLGDIRLPEWFAYIFGLSGITYGAFQRRHRKETTGRLAENNRRMQTIINPERKSSGIMPDGSVPEGGAYGN